MILHLFDLLHIQPGIILNTIVFYFDMILVNNTN